MESLRLHGTPLSRFTRKIRVLLAELGVDFELVRVPGVLATSAGAYGDNPLMRVPTLDHGGETVFDSDHIARYVVGAFDPGDRLGVRSENARDLNRLAVANGIMANEVVLILAKRGGLADVEGVAYFRKLGAAIEGGLAWLEVTPTRTTTVSTTATSRRSACGSTSRTTRSSPASIATHASRRG